MSFEKATEVRLKLNTGADFPALGLGTANRADPPKTKEAVIAAVEAGYRHIDTAWRYGSEGYIGEALKDLFARGVVTREELFITTKVWPTHWDIPKQSFEESLRRLGVDYVDLLLQHWPLAFKKVYEENGDLVQLPVDENGEYLFDENGHYLQGYKNIEDLYLEDKGKRIRAIGVSNYAIPYLEELLKVARVVPAVDQIELHPHLPQKDIVNYAESKGILITAYSPLGANGAPNLKIPLVQEAVKKYNVTPNEVLISYHIRQGRSVIPRSINTERIRNSIRLVPLTEEELEAFDNFGKENPARHIRDKWGANIPGFEYWTG
ncbi:unnamed protein product [Kuraishia capsulata CBS 1993]|uniref:NADP-dependent oxidoreductase domain-containing protein n=1 Tax=Kuraishia capsulata CBS 1993 TaxID=1382522 RepID=W6MTS2_9ASCO|nr:uncharacterized protein KUCA_T00001177001 [Kuraishia capsulata CBS 1993]CDK25210.1 unnamed protein product [Kuraishia capsulata CBS 1993]